MATKFITISIEIMHDKNLTANQKFILAEIEQLSQLDNGCIASNQHFSELTGIARESVSRCINDLEKKGYISIEIVNGTRNHTRIISLNKMLNPPKQNVKPPLTKHQETKGNKTTIIQKLYSSLMEEEKDLMPFEYIEDFYNYRKQIKRVVKTIGPLKSYNKTLIELISYGYNLEEINKFINLMKENEWQTLKTEYVHKGDINQPRYVEHVM